MNLEYLKVIFIVRIMNPNHHSSQVSPHFSHHIWFWHVSRHFSHPLPSFETSTTNLKICVSLPPSSSRLGLEIFRSPPKFRGLSPHIDMREYTELCGKYKGTCGQYTEICGNYGEICGKYENRGDYEWMKTIQISAPFQWG